ncbi:unnamed protein product [Caenorhabditis brenneri]
MKIFHVVMILVLISPAMAVTCFFSNEFNDEVDLQVSDYCTAYYKTNENKPWFGGSDNNGVEVEVTTADETVEIESEDKDCLLKVYKDLPDDESHVYVCTCHQDMCNYPYSWDEFRDRGYTLSQDADSRLDYEVSD